MHSGINHEHENVTAEQPSSQQAHGESRRSPPHLMIIDF